VFEVGKREMKYPVGPKTQRLAANTQAGRLAALLNRVLYSADVRDVPIIDDVVKKRWVAEELIYKSDDPFPDGVSAPDSKAAYFKTEDLMRAIRDYLEFRSFEEVIP